MIINGTHFTMDWEQGTFFRQLLDVDILKVKAVVYENEHHGKWQLILGDKVIHQDIIEGDSVADTKNKIEDAIQTKIEEVMVKIGAMVPDIISLLQNQLGDLSKKVDEHQVSIENNSKLINDCKEELADHEYRISVLEGVPVPINARRNPSGR